MSNPPILSVPTPPTTAVEVLRWARDIARSLTSYSQQVTSSVSSILATLTEAGALADRPESTGTGGLYIATDTGELYHDAPEGWQLVTANPNQAFGRPRPDLESPLAVADDGVIFDVPVTIDSAASPQLWIADKTGAKWSIAIDKAGNLQLLRPDGHAAVTANDESGWIGLGTAAPNSPLHVVGDQPSLLYLQNPGGNAKFTLDNGSTGTTWVMNNAAGQFRFAGNGPSVAQVVMDLDGNLVIQGHLTQVVDACIITRTTPQSILAGSATYVQFTNELHDPEKMFDSATDNTKINIRAGIWLVSAWVDWDSNTSGNRGIQIFEGASSAVVYDHRPATNPTLPGTTEFHSGASILYASAASYIRMQVFQDSSGPLNLQGATLKVVRIS